MLTSFFAWRKVPQLVGLKCAFCSFLVLRTVVFGWAQRLGQNPAALSRTLCRGHLSTVPWRSPSCLRVCTLRVLFCVGLISRLALHGSRKRNCHLRSCACETSQMAEEEGGTVKPEAKAATRMRLQAEKNTEQMGKP